MLARPPEGVTANVRYADAERYFLSTFNLQPFSGKVCVCVCVVARCRVPYRSPCGTCMQKELVAPDPDAGCLACLSRPPALSSSLHAQRVQVVAISCVPFTYDETMHERMLQTIYKKLTGSKLNCARISQSWGVIGFQGADPRTDFRTMGMLSVLCMLFAVEKYPAVRRWPVVEWCAHTLTLCCSSCFACTGTRPTLSMSFHFS